MDKRILCAGFGGQGVLAMGQMITYAGMIENYEVSRLPSYGPEMRGGAANCSVVLSDNPVGAPNINVATDVIVMNQPSFDKFKDMVEDHGNLFINTSIIDIGDFKNDKINIFEVAVSSIAKDLGNIKMANMVMLGSFLEVSKLLKLDSILEAFSKVFGDEKKALIPQNKIALEKGMDLIEENMTKGEREEYRKTPTEFSDMNEEITEFNLDYDDDIFKDPLKVAEYALEFEKGGIRLYESLAKDSSKSNAPIFKSLLDQEKEHVYYLEELIKSLKDEKDFNPKFNDIEEIAFSDTSSDDMMVTNLMKALYIEKNELEFYKKAIEKINCDKSKSLYKELLKREQFHYDEIDDNLKLHKDNFWSDRSFSKI